MIHLKSVAKINLFLKITSILKIGNFKGYHEIYTLFLPLPKIADDIFITEGDFEISCNHPEVPTDEKNLVFKIVNIFEKESQIKVNLKINIDKKIPVAGGMAGGSSNAGTVLKFLNDHYKTNFSSQKLIEMSSKIGADIAFFLNPETTLASGIGNIFNPIPSFKFDLPILIFTFDFGISAKWAYVNISYQKNQEKKIFSKTEIIEISKTNDNLKIAEMIDNDLSPAIFQKYSILDNLKKVLYKNHALKVEISGSGPSLFAVFDNYTDRDFAKNNVDEKLYQNVYSV